MFTDNTFPGNCGMLVLHEFQDWKPSEEDLNYHLKEILADCPHSIIAFSGNERQDRDYEWGPHRFAEWLKKKGEKVNKTSKVLNHGSGNVIQAFYWLPSLKFRKKYGMRILDMSPT